MEPVLLTATGVERRYFLARPPRLPAAGELPPLLVMLHGTGGSGLFAADETGWLTLAAQVGFAIAFPDALPPDPTRTPAFLSNPQRWNDGITRPGDPLHHEHDDVAFLSAVIEDALARLPADPRRVVLVGFSNGAAMTFRFAAERSELLAAIAPVAGYCPPHLPQPVRPPPTLFILGDSDPLVPLGGGPVVVPWEKRPVLRRPVDEMLAEWALRLGCEEVPTVVDEQRGVREEVYLPHAPSQVEFRRVIVHGLGHHWPGGKGQLNPRIGGSPSHLLSANERIWNFVSRHW